MKTKLSIISADSLFKKYLEEELVKHNNELISKTNNIIELTRYLQRGSEYVLILDLETYGINVNPSYIKTLSESYGVHTIIIGIKQSAPYSQYGIKGTFSKPDLKNEFAKKIFVRNIAERISVFNRGRQQLIVNINDVADVSSKVITIAASTGGTEALNVVLGGLPKNTPPILIVQHMPSVFTYQFAMRLDKLCSISVKEAALNDYAKNGLALIAPGDYHMKAVKKENKLFIECFMGEKVHAVRPAADVLFESMSTFMGPNVIGVVLTGMGSDGAHGLYHLKKKGAKVIAQDKESCVVYGMPKAAVNINAVDFILPLNKIAEKIMQLSNF